jgi:CRISPR/Cas system endoribonuclease Cas6 (RAMP superfamily)
VLKLLNLPKESVYKQFIPKKQFYTHGNLKPTERKVFRKVIERMTLYAQLTSENTNISPFKDEERTYEEISVFLVEVREAQDQDIKKVATLIMESIPYPIILIMEFSNQYNFVGVHQRDNLVDEEKIILEKVYQTGFISQAAIFIEQINYLNLNKINFFTFYNDYIQAIIEFNLASRNIEQTEKSAAATLERIEMLEDQITTLKGKLKRESHFNKKMELNMKIKSLEKELKQMED